MSDLDRIKKLSGILNEDYQEETLADAKKNVLELLVDIAKTSRADNLSLIHI